MPRKTNNKRINAYDFKEVSRRFGVPDTTDAVTQDAIVRILEPTGARGPLERTGTDYYLHTFFPGIAKDETTPAHIEFLTMLDDNSIARQATMAYRGFRKTTYGQIAVSRRIHCRMEKYIHYQNSNYAKAAEKTENIKQMVLHPDLQVIFGNMQPQRIGGRSPGFSEDSWCVVDPDTNVPFCYVSPCGPGQSVNGVLAWVNDQELSRATLIWCDDSQPRADIHNERVRANYVEWVEDELLQTIDTSAIPIDGRWDIDAIENAPWRQWVTDSCKHVDSWLMSLMDKPDWETRAYAFAEEQEDGTYKSLVPYLTDQQVMAKYNEFKSRPDSWAREFLCKPSARNKATFDIKMVKHYDDRTESKVWDTDTVKFIVDDPAHSKNKQSNCCSILAVGANPAKRRISFRRNIVRKMLPEEHFKALFEMAIETGTRIIAVEVTGAQETLKYTFQQAAKTYGLDGQIRWIWLKSIKSDDGNIKVQRSGALLPYYRAGLIYHDHSLENGPIERAYKQWPDCKHWDGPDTAGHSLNALAQLGIVLNPDTEQVLAFPDGDDEDDFDRMQQHFYEGCLA